MYGWSNFFFRRNRKFSKLPIVAPENPNIIIKCRNQYSCKIIVWLGLFYNQIVGLYFCTGKLTAEDLQICLAIEINTVLDKNEFQKQIFMVQAGWCIGAPLYCWHKTVSPSNARSRVVGLGWEHYRPPDLTISVCLLWRYLNKNIYKCKPFTNIVYLKNTIFECFVNTNPQFIWYALKDVNRRTITCIEHEDRHTEV